MNTSRTNYEEVMNTLSSINPTFSKDGNMYCFLLGEDLMEGIAGFGTTEWGAALAFIQEFLKEKR